jgi:Ca2+/H+ antiporter
MIVLLVLSIVVVGNFLRDGESNYLEGALLVVSLFRSHSGVIYLPLTGQELELCGIACY